MHALNIIARNTQRQIKPIHNLYKDYLNNIFDSNLDNIVTKTVYTKPGPSKQRISIT